MACAPSRRHGLPALVAGLGEATIPELAAASADRVPDRVALALDGEPVTHAELDAGAARVAAWLAGRLAPGDRVLLAAGSSPGFLRCYLGRCAQAPWSCWPTPAAPPRSSPTWSPIPGAGRFRDAARPGCWPGCRSATDRRPRRGPRRARPAGDPGRPRRTALLAYTSGTTGRPKAVPLTHRQLLPQSARRWRPGAGARTTCWRTPCRCSTSTASGVCTPRSSRAPRPLGSKFTAADLAAPAAHRASVLFAVPTMYQALLETQSTRAAAGRPAAGRVRLGSAEPPSCQRRRGLGRAPLVRTARPKPASTSHTPPRRPGGTVGVPLPGVLARIWSGKRRPRRAPTARSSCAARTSSAATRHDPAATAAAFTADGWFRSGDIGRWIPAPATW